MGDARVLPARRRAKILELLQKGDGVASLRDMADALGMSLSTTRRDVEYLCDSGHLQRTHGGAILNLSTQTAFEPEPDIASALASRQKMLIGRVAAAMIQPGQSILFDSGSTTAAAAAAARERGVPFTAFTNDLDIARLLSGRANGQTFVSGGYVRPGSATLIGAGALAFFRRLRVDIAFVGTHAATEEALSDTSVELAEVKQTIVAAAERVVLLADASKFGRRALFAFGQTSEIDLIVTDEAISADVVARLGSAGAVIEIAAERG